MMDKYAEHKLMCMLQNSKHHIAVPVLCKEYCDTFGYEFPFRELGFSSLEEYLKSCSEVSCVWCEKSKCYFASYKPQESQFKYQSEQYLQLESSSRGSKTSSDVGQSKLKKVPAKEHKVLNEILDFLVHIVKNQNGGLTVSELSMWYEKNTGDKLNLYEYGFNTFYEFIETVDELEIVNKNGTDKVFWTHVPSHSKFHKSSVGKYGNFNYGKKVNAVCSDNLSDSNNCLSPDTSNKYHHKRSNFSAAENNIGDTVKTVFKRILKNHPEGVWASHFSQKYKEITGHYFEMQDVGYYNFITLIEDLPSIFAWKENVFSTGDFLLFDAETFKESKEKIQRGDTFDKLCPAKKLEVVISNIRTLLSFNEDGVYLEQFFYLYKLNFGRVFNLDDFGYQSLKPFLDSLAKCVPLCIVSARKTTKIYSCHSESPDQITECIRYPVPSDIVFGDANKLKPQWIPGGVNSDGFVHMYIATFHNPDDFYIQFDEGDTIGVLDQLMNDLQSFYYSDEGDLYRVHDKDIKKGFIGVGLYGNKQWHRVEILDVFSTSVNVAFIDYGSLWNMDKKDLRYLRKKFYDCPSQAVKARLANVRPSAAIWSSDVQNFVIDMVAEQRLKASIFGYKMLERILYLHLWGISDDGSPSYSVNDVLVQKRYADFCDDTAECVNITVNSNMGIQKHKFHGKSGSAVGISNSEVAGISSSFGGLESNTKARCKVRNPFLTDEIIPSVPPDVYNHQNSSLLSLIQSALCLNSADKSSASNDFTNQLVSLLHQNVISHPDRGTSANHVSQNSDCLHSFLNILSQNKNHATPNIVSKSSLGNHPFHTETKTVIQSLQQNGVCTNPSIDSQGCQMQFAPSKQVSRAGIKTRNSTSVATLSTNFSYSDKSDQACEIIPPSQAPNQMHHNGSHHTSISLPVSSHSGTEHSRKHSASARSTHSLDSSCSSDGKYSACGSTSPSTCDLELCSDNGSPLSSKASFSWRPSLSINEPEQFNELYECPDEKFFRENMLQLTWNVKRLFLENYEIVHIIKLLGKPYVPVHDLSNIVGCSSVKMLMKKATEKGIYKSPVRIYKSNDEVLFQEIESYGINEITHKTIGGERIPVLHVYPMRVVLEYIRAFNKCPEVTINSMKCALFASDGCDDY